jgi:hypothetical protein
MRSYVWLMAAWPVLGCSGVEVDALSLRVTDMASDPSPPPPDLGRPPPPPRCTMRRQGDGRTCQSATLWKLSAQQDCRSRGERLDSLMPFDPCGLDRYRLIAYSCCTVSLPPPPLPGPTAWPGRPDDRGRTLADREPPGRGGLGS